MVTWFRWLSRWHTEKWHRSTFATKEEAQDYMRTYMDPLAVCSIGTMYEVTDIDPPMSERFAE